MSRPFKLYRLQQIDTQLDLIRARIKEIEIKSQDDSELVSAEKVAASSREQLELARQAQKAADYEVQQVRIKIEQTEAALYGGKVRNPKELQDLQTESASLKRHLNTLEERQFETMVSEEEASNRFTENSRILEKTREAHRQNVEALFQEKSKLEKNLSRTEGERSAASSSIEESDLSAYQLLRQKRRGIAVSKVVDRACSACGTTLNSTLLNAAHSPNQVQFCDNCGRILYTG